MTKLKEDLLGESLNVSNLIQRGALDVETAMISQEVAMPRILNVTIVARLAII